MSDRRGKKDDDRRGKKDDDSEVIRIIPIRDHREKPQRDTRRDREEVKKYRKAAPSKQDIISRDPEQVDAKLANFERISEDQYADVETGTFIRYKKFSANGKTAQIRLGGYVIKNSAPDYWVLRSGSKGKQVTWSVPLKCVPSQSCKPNVYYKKAGLPSKSERERNGAEALEALQSGRYRLIEVEKLNALTGEAPPRSRVATKMTRDEEDEEEEEYEESPVKKHKINFTKN